MADPAGQGPTEQDMAAGAEVVAAGQEAADQEPDESKKRGAARGAIQKTAKDKGWTLSDADADKLAGAVTGKIEELFDSFRELLEGMPDQTADRIGQRGGYDKLPEPLQAPAAPTGAGTLPAEPPVSAATHDEQPGEGRSRGGSSFARWFRSG